MFEILFYLGSILLANLLVHQFGIVTVLGITFPAGAVAIGLTFSARDFVQQRWGKWGCWGWMLVASGITFLFNQRLAIASVTAFFIAETLDWLIFTLCPGSLQKRIVLSNLIGCPLDSLVFVCLAFGWVWPAIWGQTVVKMASSMIALAFARRRDEQILWGYR